MGNFVTKYLGIPGDIIWMPKIGKRKREESIGEELFGPERKKLKGLPGSKHLYERMFESGIYSDITIVVWDVKWHLHKIALVQSPYFATMLNGTWKESGQEIINIDVLDEEIINQEAMNTMFRSLYTKDISMSTRNIVPTMVAASRFQVMDLFMKCSSLMSAYINSENVIECYQIADRYGWPDIKQVARRHLLHGITYNQKLTSKEFLLTEEGIKYQRVFKKLRLDRILLDSTSLRCCVESKVIPNEWIFAAQAQLHTDSLHLLEGLDPGPLECTEDYFDARCCRFGRILKYLAKPTVCAWSWPTANFAIWLTWEQSSGALQVMRKAVQNPTNSVKRRIVIRSKTLANRGRNYVTCTEARIISLTPGQRAEICKLPDDKDAYPLLLQVEILFTSDPTDPEECEDR